MEKTQICAVRVTPVMLKEILKAAEAEDSSVSSWLRGAAKEKLKEVGGEA